MSIADEDGKFFENPNESIINAVGRPLRRTISIRCQYTDIMMAASSCRSCVGRKYSIRNGCPVCGSEINAANLSDLAVTCSKCDAVILTCGLLDIRAVTLPPEFNDVIMDEGDSI